jgi:hypothetical protein
LLLFKGFGVFKILIFGPKKAFYQIFAVRHTENAVRREPVTADPGPAQSLQTAGWS